MSVFFYPQTELQKTQAEVQKMVQEVQKKIKEIKHSVVLKKVSLKYILVYTNIIY